MDVLIHSMHHVESHFLEFQHTETGRTVQNQARYASRVTPNFIREIDRSDTDEFNARLLFVLCLMFIELKIFMLPCDSVMVWFGKSPPVWMGFLPKPFCPHR